MVIISEHLKSIKMNGLCFFGIIPSFRSILSDSDPSPQYA